MTSRRLAILFAVIPAMVVAACGSGSAATSGPSIAGGPLPLTVRDAWVRAAPAGGDTAAYFTIVNGPAADTLVGVGSELKVGDQVVLQLSFEHAGVVKVTCEVRAS